MVALTATPTATPSEWVVRFAASIPEQGTVLDVAAGRGRHSSWLQARGHRVTAIDRDIDALTACGALETIAFDLEAGADWPLAGRRFDAVVVTNYLHRPLFPALLAAVEDGGLLIYETFAVGNERFGKPGNPDFLLRPGELIERCRGFEIVAFEDGIVGTPATASVQRLCAIKPSPNGIATPRRRL